MNHSEKLKQIHSNEIENCNSLKILFLGTKRMWRKSYKIKCYDLN